MTVIERSAGVRKSHKYEWLCDRYIFQAIAIESSGEFGRDTDAFISRLGHLTTSISGEHPEAEFLRQRCHMQQSVETPNLLHNQAAKVHELGLPYVICESHFVKFTLCIFFNNKKSKTPLKSEKSPSTLHRAVASSS